MLVAKQPGRSHVPQVSAENVLIVIPTLNEAAHIEPCINSLVDSDPLAQTASIVVADGGSTDGTRDIVSRLAAHLANVSLLDNPKRLQSAALNLAAEHASDSVRYIVRCDAHSLYPKGFVSHVVAALEKTGADSVVVPMDAVGEGCFGKANAWIVDTPLGSGGALHRGGGRSGYVDHGHHAGFSAKSFRRLKGYDASFSHNEDAEYDYRLKQDGGKIYLDSDIRIQYIPRGTGRGLAKQYFSYGKGRARNLMKHGAKPKPRQLIPVLVLLLCLLGFALSPFLPLALLLPAGYLGLLATASVYIAIQRRSVCGLFAGPASGIMHMSWAAGFLRQYLVRAK